MTDFTENTNSPSTNTEDKTYPAYNVFTTVPHGRGSKIGSRIGVIFTHRNGDGMNLILDASPIPVDGQINLTIFPYEKK